MQYIYLTVNRFFYSATFLRLPQDYVAFAVALSRIPTRRPETPPLVLDEERDAVQNENGDGNVDNKDDDDCQESNKGNGNNNGKKADKVMDDPELFDSFQLLQLPSNITFQYKTCVVVYHVTKHQNKTGATEEIKSLLGPDVDFFTVRVALYNAASYNLVVSKAEWQPKTKDHPKRGVGRYVFFPTQRGSTLASSANERKVHYIGWTETLTQ